MIIVTTIVDQRCTFAAEIGSKAAVPFGMNDRKRIALIAEAVDACEGWQEILSREGYDCSSFSDSREAVSQLRGSPPDVVLVDLKMPDLDGLDVLQEIKKFSSRTVVILITAHAAIPPAVQAVGEGALDYLPKPFTRRQLLEAVSRGLRSRTYNSADPVDTWPLNFSEVIGTSPAITEVLELAKRAAQTDCNVVLLGESGTGKELIARTIHANSARRNHAFLPIDCAALPEPLLESELFGHEKGTFTGAYASRVGLIETAGGGTVFLDEVAELTPGTQAKLLRVLEERQVRHLGGRELIDVDVRFMCATHKDLQFLVEQGQFREDLFYRLNVLVIEVPPLRSRKSDIPLLACHFLEHGACGGVEGISAAAMMVLENYDWPGNARELRNIVERACTLARSETITPLDLPAYLLRSGDVVAPGPFQRGKRQAVEAFERRRLAELLSQTSGNVAQAANLACMDRTAFQRLMRKYGIRSTDFHR